MGGLKLPGLSSLADQSNDPAKLGLVKNSPISPKKSAMKKKFTSEIEMETPVPRRVVTTQFESMV